MNVAILRARGLQLIIGAVLLISGFVCGQQTSFCTNGFTVSLSSGQSFRNGRQYIFPFINFTCHGNITLWRFYARFNDNEGSTLYPEFQIWRLTGSLYTKVSHTNISSDDELAGNFTGGGENELYTHNISVSGPMTFQPGDIVGVHTPVCCGSFNPRSRLRLRFNQQSNGPLGYFLNQGIDTQPSSTFQLSDSSVSTSSQDIPALSAQLVMFETTSFSVSSAVIKRTSTLSISSLSTGVISLQATNLPSSSRASSRKNSHSFLMASSFFAVTTVTVTVSPVSKESNPGLIVTTPRSIESSSLGLTVGVAAGVCLAVVLIVITGIIFALVLCFQRGKKKREEEITNQPSDIHDNVAYGINYNHTRGKGHLNDNVKMSLDQKEKLEKQISDSPSVLQENPAYSIHHTRGYGHMDVAESLGNYDYICTGPCSGAELTVNSLK